MKTMIMSLLISLFFLPSFAQQSTIYHFKKPSNIGGWVVIDDIVMGGISKGTLKMHPDGYGVFEGDVSLENNGGFSSIRYRFDKIKVNASNKIIFRVKGNKNSFQLRVKESAQTEYSYIAEFATSGSWQTIEISLKDMYPSYRGRKLNRPNFSHNQIEEITFLIGNGKAEKFQLLIDKIEVE